MKIIAFILATLTFAGEAIAVSPSSLIMKVYSMGLSASTDCSNPITVFDSASPVSVDFVTGHSFASGSPPDNTYNCVIMRISDQVTYVPASTTGSCIGGTTYTREICKSSRTNQAWTPGTATFASAASCTTGLENTVTLFMSTGSASISGSNPFLQPTTSTNGIRLNGAFVVSGSIAGTFVVNLNDKIDGSGATCDMFAPEFGFR